MATRELQAEAQHALVLGWTMNELIGRHNRYLHPDDPARKDLTRRRLPPLTYSVQEEMRRNTDQAFAQVLQLNALIDALQFHEPDRSSLKVAVLDLAAAIRTYQRTRIDQPPLGTTRFWQLLDDLSSVIRSKLYSIGRPVEVCMRLGGALAALYWLIPVDGAGRPVHREHELGARYLQITRIISLLDELADFLPPSLANALRYTLTKWHPLTQELEKAGSSITQPQATLIIDALAKQSENWATLVLGEKTSDEYLTTRDQLLVRFISFLAPGALLLALTVALALLLPFLWDRVVTIALPQLAQIPIPQWFDPTKIELKLTDLLSIATALGAAIASASVAAVWFGHRLDDLRRFVLDWAKNARAARRILVLPKLSYPYSWVLTEKELESRSKKSAKEHLDMAGRLIAAGEYPLAAIPSLGAIARLLKEVGQKYQLRLDDLQEPQLIAQLIRDYGEEYEFGLEDLTESELRTQVRRILQPPEG